MVAKRTKKVDQTFLCFQMLHGSFLSSQAKYAQHNNPLRQRVKEI